MLWMGIVFPLSIPSCYEGLCWTSGLWVHWWLQSNKEPIQKTGQTTWQCRNAMSIDLPISQSTEVLKLQLHNCAIPQNPAWLRQTNDKWVFIDCSNSFPAPFIIKSFCSTLVEAKLALVRYYRQKNFQHRTNGNVGNETLGILPGREVFQHQSHLGIWIYCEFTRNVVGLSFSGRGVHMKGHRNFGEWHLPHKHYSIFYFHHFRCIYHPNLHQSCGSDPYPTELE